MMRAMARMLRLDIIVLAAMIAPVIASSRVAFAAPPYVDRSLTLPRLVFAGDVGLGIAHLRTEPLHFTGAGLNLEAALGITDSVELGLRTGIRLGDDGKVLGADAFGRTRSRRRWISSGWRSPRA
jgi:hypothetical protein